MVEEKRLVFFLVNFFYFLFLSSCMFCGFAVLFWRSFENFSVSRKKCLVKFCPQLPGEKNEKCIDFADIKLDVY